jgi:ribose transport system substrate-binding protein
MEDKAQLDLTNAMSRRSMLRLGGGVGAAALAGGVQFSAFLEGSNPAFAADKPLTVAVVAQQMAAQSDQRAWDGLQQWLRGMKLEDRWKMNLTDAKGDPGTLVSQVQDAISAKADAILVMFGTLTAAHSALVSLTESKIPFFSLDSGWQAPAIADITSNNYVIGSQMSQQMVDELLARGKEKAKICAIIADFHHGTRKRGKVMRVVLSENQWISLADERVIQYAGFYETTQNAVNDWVTRFGDEIDAIWCPWDEPAMAAAEVIVAHKLQDKIFVVAEDGHPTAIEKMRQPDWPQICTCAQSFELWGAYTGWLINEIVGKGRNAKEVVPTPIVQFPAPLLVKGVNLPKPGEPPYEATDLYYIYRDRAIAGMKG